MGNIKRAKRKKRKLNYKRCSIFLGIILAISGGVIYLNNLHIKRIKIIGTNLISDKEIIETANIKDYPKIFSLSSGEIKNKLNDLDLVNEVKVKKNLLGTITIIIDEDIPLYYDDTKKVVITSNNKEIKDNNSIGIPKLNNHINEDMSKDLIKALKKLDNDILSIINEMTYSPTQSSKGEAIDNKRFIFKMNDGNEVVINTLNMNKLNDYYDLVAVKNNNMNGKLGIFYLDSATNNNTFKSYESIKNEEVIKEDVKN